MATEKTEASKAIKPPKAKAKPKVKAKPKMTSKKPRIKATDLSKMEDVARAKGKQEFVKVARTKNKKTPRTWVIVYKLMARPDMDVRKSRKRAQATSR